MLYAIGDLHLSANMNKKMDKFGLNWINHTEKIKSNLLNLKDTDTLLILGDTSWGKTIDEAYEDLKLVDSFKGQKYLIQGNHDYWWSGKNKLKNELNLNFIKFGVIKYKDYAICCTKGSNCPSGDDFDEYEQKIYIRESNRLRNSLLQAKSEGFNKFIVILHYPPTNDRKENSLYTDIINEFNVKLVLYAHLHGEENFNASLLGIHKGTNYMLVSSDYLNFKAKEIVL